QRERPGPAHHPVHRHARQQALLRRREQGARARMARLEQRLLLGQQRRQSAAVDAVGRCCHILYSRRLKLRSALRASLRRRVTPGYTPVTGRSVEPSEKRAKRKGAGSTSGGSPVTRSAISRPAPGPMPKPWPEKPVAMKKPGSCSTGE